MEKESYGETGVMRLGKDGEFVMVMPVGNDELMRKRGWKRRKGTEEWWTKDITVVEKFEDWAIRATPDAYAAVMMKKERVTRLKEEGRTGLYPERPRRKGWRQE
jgi:hypothetical protein